MKNQLVLVGIAVLLIAVGLSGCVTPTNENPIEQGKVSFKLEEVITTSELEIELSENETTIQVSNDIKFVIITITVENREDKLLYVNETNFGGLSDDAANRYQYIRQLTIGDVQYNVSQLSLLDYGELLGYPNEYISANSTELRKTVYAIPIDKEPTTLRLRYGFKSDESSNVENWFVEHLYIPDDLDEK